jgi:nitrogen fixation protein FixH
LGTIPEHPTEGPVRFHAMILRADQPVTDAKVELSLSMPTMEMGGPTIPLQHRSNGIYEGDADLSMGGEWQARLTIQGPDGQTGLASYQFVALQR